jgi:anti-anti-sigma factor
MKLAEIGSGEESAIALQGRLDSSTVRACEAALLQHIEDGRQKVILDLSGVDYIGGQGLRILVLAQRRAESLGISFSICNPSSAVDDALAQMGAHRARNKETLKTQLDPDQFSKR